MAAAAVMKKTKSPHLCKRLIDLTAPSNFEISKIQEEKQPHLTS